MLVTRDAYGLYLPDADLHLDARRAPGTVFVSHAHGDHCSDAARIVCTPETAALHAARRGAREAVTLPFGEPARFGDATVTLTPAGHALGSAMLVAESARGRVAYTGDYKLRENPFSPPVTIPRVDTLIMECTFGEPRYVFPPAEQLVAELLQFVETTRAAGATPVVLAYALGKGQEALWHLTRAGCDVVLHGAIANLCALHEQLGYTFPGPGTWSRYERGKIGDRVLMTTPQTRKTAMVQKLPAKRTVYLTGWALHPGAWNIYKDCDLVLPFSDHADYTELVRTARESGASKVYTVHGPATFAGRLRELGIDAEHLMEHPNEAEEPEPDEGPPPSKPSNQLGLF
ncbi:MBL fold metallo-hydrolase [Roseisolibacter agri]|uniref:DNA ligase-associated DEXH box helicase n=1 Tax=Roseisolibacter agri TaxID=2014610 RepID=A0AA37V0H2_9BACT|nr:MBL fold metallo-hydrolase [Roseisolibacter agri]GLC24475.1 DNA ligase-associated DEXH box helicase [Roseisolibacter agri]